MSLTKSTFSAKANPSITAMPIIDDIALTSNAWID